MTGSLSVPRCNRQITEVGGELDLPDTVLEDAQANFLRAINIWGSNPEVMTTSQSHPSFSPHSKTIIRSPWMKRAICGTTPVTLTRSRVLLRQERS